MKEKFVFSLITGLSSNVLFLFASYILLLKLDIASIGIWVFLNTVVNLGFLFINVGFDSIHYQYSGKENISDYIGTYFMIKVVLLIINIIITLGLLAILQIWNTKFIAFSLLWLGNIIRNEDLTIFGDGTNSRDFIYIKDVIQANLLAAKNDVSSEIFNIGRQTIKNFNLPFYILSIKQYKILQNNK